MMKQTSIDRAKSIWNLTWPQMAMLMCQFVIGITDVWAGGRLGSDVQASIGLITQCQMVFMALGIGATSGVVATVSQSLGAGKTLRAERYVALVVTGALALGFIIAISAHIFRQPFLRLVQTPESILPVAMLFLSICLWSLPGQYALSIGAGVFRASKSVKKPLYATIAVCLLNVFGDLAFGLGWWGFPAYGAAGIAWSTFISVNCGGLVMLLLLRRDKLLTSRGIPDRRWVKAGAPYLLKVAAPALGTSLLWQIGYMVLMVLTATLPTGRVAAIAGLTAGMRIEALLFMPAVAFNMTASVLVGHALGMGNKTEAKRITFSILLFACTLMSLVGACMWPFREQLGALLAEDPEVIREIASYLTYNILSAPFTVASVVMAGALGGAGATIYPLIAYSVSVWLVRLPVAWLFGHIIWQNADGVYLSMLVSQVVQSSSLVWVALRCNWQRFAMGHHARSAR